MWDCFKVKQSLRKPFFKMNLYPMAYFARTFRELGFLVLLVISFSGKAQGEVTLYLPFDGTVKPDFALGDESYRSSGSIDFVPGVFGKALVVRQETKLVYKGGKNFDMSKGTCSLWVKPIDWTPDEDNFYFFLTLKYTNQNKQSRVILYKFIKNEALRLLFENEDIGDRSLLEKPIVTWGINQWHHLVFSWNEDDGLKLYVDGELVGRQKHIEMPMDEWEIVLGIPWPNWPNLGSGKTAIDDLTVYSHALSESEIRTVYENAVANNQNEIIGSAIQKQRHENDLAGSGNGTYILASSFADLDTFYPDNLINEQSDGFWRASSSNYPQWLELRWPHPVRVNKVIFSEIPPTDIKSYSVYKFEQDQWKLLKRKDRREPTISDSVSCEFEITTTDRLRIVLEKGNGKHIQLANLEVLGPPQDILGAIEPYWHGWYITYPEPDGIHPAHQSRYFRKTFEIDDLDALKAASIQLRSNDYYKAYINGIEIGRGATENKLISVRDHLRLGDNVIAVEMKLFSALSVLGTGNINVDLALNYESNNIYISTDQTWKAHDQLEESWIELGFDDRAWVPSFEYVKPPAGPWGKIPYTSSGWQESIVVEDVIVSPDELKPGGVALIDITVSSPHGLNNDYVFMLDFGIEEVIDFWSNFHLSSSIVEPSVPTSRWDTGEHHRISARIQLPPWSPHGQIPIRLRSLDKNRGVDSIIYDLNGSAADVIGTISIDRLGVKSDLEHAEASGTQVISKNGYELLSVDGEIFTPITWQMFTPSFEKYHRYSKSGNNIFFLNDPDRIDGSFECKNTSKAHFDLVVRNLLAIDPNAKIILTFDLRPTQQWLVNNPKERVLTGLGEFGPVSMSSEKYWLLVKDHIETVIRYLMKQPYAESIIGYRPISIGLADSRLGTGVGNVFQADRSKVTIGDFNPQAIQAFQRYLREKYANSVAGLRESWNDPTVNFDTARPVLSELTAPPTDGGVFIDPMKGNKKYDYLEFLSTLVSHNYLRIAKLIKEETDYKALVGIHYGYRMEHMRRVHPPGAQGDNNFDLKNLMESPLIDFYCGAMNYNHRRAGGPFQSMHAMASLRLHNKLYMCDADHRTAIAHQTAHGRQYSLEETVAVIQRDMASAIIHGFGNWHADMSRGRDRSEIGWFTDPAICEAIDQMNDIYKEAIKTPAHSAAEIAVVLSGHTWYYHDIYNAQNIYSNLIGSMLYGDMPYIGAPFDVYFMDDLKEVGAQDQYKMYVFINPFYMSDEEAESVEDLKRDGKTLLWFYAPGYVNRRTGLSAENISNVTGISVFRKPLAHEVMECYIVGGDNAITREMDEGDKLESIGFQHPNLKAMHSQAYGPVFYIDDPSAMSLARYSDGSIAMAAKNMGDWKSIYCAIPVSNRTLLRNIAKDAGVHLYSEPGVVMDASSNLVMVHNGFDGPQKVTINLPEKRDVYDLLGEKVIGKNVDTIRSKIGICETQIFQLTDGSAERK